MQYEIEMWDIRMLIAYNNEKKLDIHPPYQRNEIWPVKAKQKLINSIKKGIPIPNFFLYKKEDNQYEVVDGQQRTRTILGFYDKQFKDLDKNEYSENGYPNFLNYELSITIITELESNEFVEDFYALVNSTGLKLNRQELKKAEYYNTNFLKLLEILSTNEKFESLKLFPETATNRMQDTDFVGELASLIKNGISDKKKEVDNMFEKDIDKKEFVEIKNKFEKILEIIECFNEIYEIRTTRYRQRNDFYTLFGFLNNNISLDQNTLDIFYKILVLIDNKIAPSNEECEPFMNYAYHCVTQSNSKNARIERLKFLNELFLNKNNSSNQTQKQILDYYEMNENDLVKVKDYLVFSVEILQKKIGVSYFQ